MVLELVRPEEGTTSANLGSGAPEVQPSNTAPANYVLSLDGNGSFVELPPGCFSNLTAITVEGWLKWTAFPPGADFFEFGLTMPSLWTIAPTQMTWRSLPAT